MKVLNREQFLKLKGPIVYSETTKGQEAIFSNLMLTPDVGNSFDNDWYECDLIGELEGDGTTIAEVTYNIEQGKEFKTDLESYTRNGLFDEDAMFVVWDNDDINQLIAKLQSVVNESTKR